jgi:pyruvate ferredoxin oxidoreductase gamma subunit
VYRIRLHGRGGQGIKTASRILGTALFREGFQVQDAPRYGAERRGAPIFAYVRAARAPIRERGVVHHPDLVVVADDSLIPVPAAGVLAGARSETVFLLNSAEPEAVWRERLALDGPVVALPAAPREAAELRFVGAACAGAAARCLGVIGREALCAALEDELGALSRHQRETSVERALSAWDAMAPHEGCVPEGMDLEPIAGNPPDWIELPFENADLAAPTIQGSATSVQVRTGLWRTVRPVIDYDHCNRCSWICSTFCPDSAISVDEDRKPHIDYDHCKGCGICAVVCPPHAIRLVPERDALADEEAQP